MRTATILVALLGGTAHAATLQVGPGKPYAKPCDAIAAAQPGDTIEVDAGSYDGDHCAIATDNLTIRGVGGRASINAGGDVNNVSGNKGIFAVSAPNLTVENFEFAGAVSTDANGAGIRHQGTNLTVRNCFFHDNQDGILGAPPTDGTGVVLIESSEFANNGAGDGQSHNMYLNHYQKFTIQFSYTHGAKVGHLIKTRAQENHIQYNRITDELGTTASYEIDIPNGGLSYVVGNLVEQSAATQNPTLLEYALEGAVNPDQHLFVASNTFVNDLDHGTFITVAAGSPAAVIANNIFVGPGTLTSQANATLTTNFTMDPKLVDQANYDYQLMSGSPCIDAGTLLDAALIPAFQYVHPLGSQPRSVVGAKIDIGAYEFGVMNPPDGGGSGGAGGSGGSGGSSGGGGSNGGAATDGGCGCSVGARPPTVSWLWLLGLLALRRRR